MMLWEANENVCQVLSAEPVHGSHSGSSFNRKWWCDIPYPLSEEITRTVLFLSPAESKQGEKPETAKKTGEVADGSTCFQGRCLTKASCIMSLTKKSFPGGSSGKESACQCRRGRKSGFDPWVRKIPWTEEPGGLQSMGSQRVGHDWATNTLKEIKIKLL